MWPFKSDGTRIRVHHETLVAGVGVGHDDAAGGVWGWEIMELVGVWLQRGGGDVGEATV